MVKRKIIWSLKAKNALVGILDYYFKRNGSKTYSNKLNASLRSAIRLLENHPELGVKSDIKNVRVLIHGDYAIFQVTRQASAHESATAHTSNVMGHNTKTHKWIG